MKRVFKFSHISVTNLLFGPAERERQEYENPTYEPKDMQLDTVSLSRFKEPTPYYGYFSYVLIAKKSLCPSS